MKKLIALCITLSLFAAPMIAEEIKVPTTISCNHTDTYIKTLKQKYEETPVSRGLTKDGHLVRVFLNDETRTFSILQTDPISGYSCFLTVGDFWENLGGVDIKGDL